MAGPHNVVQVYLGWANSVFNERGIQIASLSELHNGHLLFELLAVLAANRGNELEPSLSGLDDKSALEAVVETFRWLAVFGVKLSASAADVANGSMKALLDVLWEMILHLTIHSPDRKPAQRTESIGAKLLMEWCSRMLADVTFDYRKSIAENINKEVLHRLINKCCDAASSSSKVHSSSFYTAVTEAESRLGVSSMLLRTSNDAAAGYGLMVYLALLRRKVDLAACGRPMLKVDDYRKDAAQRAAADASMRQQLKQQQERTQQVLKDLENQLDSFKKMRQDSGIASQSKSSGDLLSSTALCLDTSHDDDTLRASHASFDTALHDALSVDLSSSLVAQAVRTEAVHASVSSGASGHFSPAGDLAVVAGHEPHRTTASLSGMLQDEPSAAGAHTQPQFSCHERVHTANGHCSPASAMAASAETHGLSSGANSAATSEELRSLRQSHRSASVPKPSICSLPAKSKTTSSHCQPLLLHGATTTARVGQTSSCADACDGPCQLGWDSRAAAGGGDADSASCAASHPSPSGALTTTGSQKEAARALRLRSTACASGEDVADDDGASPVGTTVPPRDDRRSQSGNYHPVGCDMQAVSGGSCDAPDLLFSLLVTDVSQLPGLPRLESTTYGESEDFVLAWLTSTPDDGMHYEVPNRGGSDYGECGTLVDDSLMTALDKIGRRNEAVHAQLHDSRRREVELLRRLAERDDLVLRLHRSLLLLSSASSSHQDGNEGPPPGALPAPSDEGVLPTSAAVSPVAAAAGAAGGSHEQGTHGDCVEDDHNDGIDAELEQYRHAVQQLHDELARCRFKVVAPLQDENRLLHKRLRLQEEQHLETCRALQDERVAQERLIVSLQLEMARFDRLLAGSASGHDRRLSPGAVDTSYSSGRDRKSVHRRGVRTKGSSASSSAAVADTALGHRASRDSHQQLQSPAAVVLHPVTSAACASAPDAKTGSTVMSRHTERSSAPTDLASGRPQASATCQSPADGSRGNDDAAAAAGDVSSVYLKLSGGTSSCAARIDCSASLGETTGLSRAVNGDVAVPESKCVSAGDSLAIAAVNCPAVVADWRESVQQELVRVRTVFGAAAHVDDITIIRAAFNLLNESISQHVASPGSGSTATAGEGREHVAAPCVAPSTPSSAAGAASLSSSPGCSSSLPAQDAASYSTLEAAKTEVERLRLKEQAMNHEFASKITIMDNLLRTKIEEAHILQDANLVLASQRDRYEIQHRQSEQECEALRSLLKQYDDQARHAAAAAAALTAATELLPPSGADEGRVVTNVLAMTADVPGGCRGIDSPCAETVTAAQLSTSASPQSGSKPTGNTCSSPMLADPIPDQPVVDTATAAGVAERVLPAGQGERELPMADRGASTPRAPLPKSSTPVLSGFDEPRRVPMAVPRSRSASPDMTSVDMNDAIINELAALNMVATDKWMLPHTVSGTGASVAKASAAVASRTERFLGAGEHRRTAYKGAAGGSHELRSRTLAPATAATTATSVTASRPVSSSLTPSRQSARMDSIRSSKFDSESSKVKPRLPATVRRTAVREAAPSSRSGAVSAFRRYEDGGPSPPALFPVLMEPSRRSRKL